MKLYGHPLSGNVHRARALLGVLGVDYEYVIVDLGTGDHKQPAFLALNPLGQVPVLTDGDLVLRDSISIMTYIAARHDTDNAWFPADAAKRALVQQWLSTAVNEIQHGPALVRAIKLFGMPVDAAVAMDKTKTLFDTLFEPQLASSDWLVGDTATAADLACYSYIARVTEGGFDLSPYPAITAWLERIEALDGFPAMGLFEDIMAAAT